jgi:prepilin-type processing-associated H-X9-DG protein
MFARRQGFSRTEMLLIGATGIVGMLALPVMSQGLGDWFGKARENARRSDCQSRLKQTALAVLQYTQDYDEKYPLIAPSNKVAVGSGWGEYGWAQTIAPYTRNREVFSCPQDRHAQATVPNKPRYTDYWYNRQLNGIDLSRIAVTPRTLLMGDGDGNSPQSNARYNLNTLPKTWKTTIGSPATRHLKGANYSFADGHVKWYLPTQIHTASPLKNKSLAATFAVR